MAGGNLLLAPVEKEVGELGDRLEPAFELVVAKASLVAVAQGEDLVPSLEPLVVLTQTGSKRLKLLLECARGLSLHVSAFSKAPKRIGNSTTGESSRHGTDDDVE